MLSETVTLRKQCLPICSLWANNKMKKNKEQLDCIKPLNFNQNHLFEP